jgi:hypothetical protein
VPSHNNVPIPPHEIAKLMHVNFNYQVNGRTGTTRPGLQFPVIGLLEHRIGSVDYAIIKLGPDTAGRHARDLFGELEVATSDLTTRGAMLCIIQHPTRQEKKIEAGPLEENRAGRIAYNGIDTASGSSGAPIVGPDGDIVGVHLKGGCFETGGFNSGAAIGAIRAVSALL